MSTSVASGASFSDSKKHYEILDGLRGVAALTVVWFHLFETFTGMNHLVQIINHGYLAVDFFFVLSGFVVGYAYDDRWNTLSLGSFFKRRLIRLHPMIVMGMCIGALCFYWGASPVVAPNISATPWWQLLLTFLAGCTLLPLPVWMDIRGWAEMHPLNGPAWTLFYEYLANILYAVLVRHFSRTLLTVLVALCGLNLLHFAVTNPQGDLIGGWSLTPEQVRIGLTRLLYPFFAGLLLSRVSTPGRVRHAFWVCSILVVAVLAFPRLGGSAHLWMNGLYDALAVLLVFPLIVYLGASGQAEGARTARICRFLGDISYPVYILHYPFIYLFTAWVIDHQVPMLDAWPAALLVFVATVVLAWASWRWYDVPVRRWLLQRRAGK